VPTFLLTVQPTDFQGGHLSVARRLSELRDRPAFGRVASGSPLELVRPDATRVRAWVVDLSTDQFELYGRGDDETVYEIFHDPLFCLRVAPRQTEADAPPGTEIWLVGNPAAD
jgi:hypothetical protein